MNFDNENTVVILTGIVVSPGEVYSLDIESHPPVVPIGEDPVWVCNPLKAFRLRRYLGFFSTPAQ